MQILLYTNYANMISRFAYHFIYCHPEPVEGLQELTTPSIKASTSLSADRQAHSDSYNFHLPFANKLAINLYAPGTPAGNCLKKEIPV